MIGIVTAHPVAGVLDAAVVATGRRIVGTGADVGDFFVGSLGTLGGELTHVYSVSRSSGCRAPPVRLNAYGSLEVRPIPSARGVARELGLHLPAEDLPVLDAAGDQVGRVRDVVVQRRADGRAPRVKGLVVELFARQRIFIPMDRVRSVDPSRS